MVTMVSLQKSVLLVVHRNIAKRQEAASFV
jgi:hypothetical protein